MANTAQAGAASFTLTGASNPAPFKTLAESRGVKRVWAQMNSFFFDPAAVSSATDNHLYSGQGLRPGSPDPTHETRK
jgi:hypothetical protein